MALKAIKIVAILVIGAGMGFVAARTYQTHSAPGVMEEFSDERLTRTSIDHATFDQKPLEQVLADLCELSNVPIIVSAEAKRELQAKPKNVTATFNHTSLGAALDELVRESSLESSRFDYLIDDSSHLVVTTIADCEKRLVLRVYPIEDLIEMIALKEKLKFDPNRPPPIICFGPHRTISPAEEARQDAIDDIIQVIEDEVAPESWLDNGGKVGRLREVGAGLYVDTTWSRHKEVAAMLNKLRQQCLAQKDRLSIK
jgi:hypothetical protein